MKFPDKGEIFPAKNKKYRELIFFVHFFEGSKKKIHPHIALVNELGFDAFAFQAHDHFSIFDLPITTELSFGLQHRIADQIENLLNLLDGDKIVFAFSGPSSAAIEAIARRGASDIRALVCDSGPSGEFLKSIYNLLEHERRLPLWQRLIQWPVFSVIWNPSLQNTLSEDLRKFPQDFKILSIRGWKDKLMPPGHIDAVFEPHSHLDWRKLSLPRAEHLRGLKEYPEDYSTGLIKFLNEVARPS
ncbi:MAG: hypothetical protein AABY64_05695 [Bdellovibrionota bacterium]